MRSQLLFFFLFTELFAQKLPVSESNYFVYDKYGYGVSLNNVTNNLFQQSNGELLVSEYSGHIYKISNTNIQKALPTLKGGNPVLQQYFKLKNGLAYYCTAQEIIVEKNYKVCKRIKLNSKNDYSNSFGIFNDQIYFLTTYKSKKLILRKFDGSKVCNLTEVNYNFNSYNNILFINDQINIITNDNNNLTISRYEKNKLIPEKTYKIFDKAITVSHFINKNSFSGYTQNNKVFYCKEGKISYFDFETKIPFLSSLYSSYYTESDFQNKKVFDLKDNGLHFLFNSSFNTSYFITKENKETNSFYVATNTSFLRYFPHIKKYPRLFNDSNSSSVFTLLQADGGKIWAGSYQGFLTTLNNGICKQSKINNFMYMNGGLAYKDKILLFAESEKGALLFTDENKFKKIADSATFFYAYHSKNNKLYLGSAGKGLWSTDISNLDKNNPIEWEIIDEKRGLNLFNIITICEDRFGNIWSGRSNQGISVYNTKKRKAITWQIDQNEIDFGSMAMFLDNRKTLWFGRNDGGLCFYDGKYEGDYDVKNFKLINHPLLKSGLGITFLKQWNDYLILGAKDKILLFDLRQWYQDKKVFVRYLNPQETSFTTPTEQNACFIDKRDQSIWFSTGDMVYQWDIKKWLTLPTFKIIPDIVLRKDTIEKVYKVKKPLKLKPSENSFDIEIRYQTRDNMPRYLNGVLVRKGEKPVFEYPNLQTKYHFSNLSWGEYVFYVQVFQQDGSYDVFEYPILIDNFFWQKWWFWALISLVPISFVFYHYKKKSEIEKTKKKLSQLNLASLSNQFRPHFMLNALNSIGSQMDDMPHAEKVISRLGESITILYGFTQNNEFAHAFTDEWKLVENIIEIQKLLFIPDLKISIIGKDIVEENYRIPVGLIQIPVENALLHGLRNKEDGSYILRIIFNDDGDYYKIDIIDNGVGRERAKEMNDFKKNGNGLKTIFEMIKIINRYEPNAIYFYIKDLESMEGTKITIRLKKQINYEQIKL
ncbi:MAG: histidine kinase [Flavobacteriales bacterium]|nr:histidine kinase [Flavobacteriales bacterium]